MSHLQRDELKRKLNDEFQPNTNSIQMLNSPEFPSKRQNTGNFKLPEPQNSTVSIGSLLSSSSATSASSETCFQDTKQQHQHQQQQQTYVQKSQLPFPTSDKFSVSNLLSSNSTSSSSSASAFPSSTSTNIASTMNSSSTPLQLPSISTFNSPVPSLSASQTNQYSNNLPPFRSLPSFSSSFSSFSASPTPSSSCCSKQNGFNSTLSDGCSTKSMCTSSSSSNSSTFSTATMPACCARQTPYTTLPDGCATKTNSILTTSSAITTSPSFTTTTPPPPKSCCSSKQKTCSSSIEDVPTSCSSSSSSSSSMPACCAKQIPFTSLPDGFSATKPNNAISTPSSSCCSKQTTDGCQKNSSTPSLYTHFTTDYLPPSFPSSSSFSSFQNYDDDISQNSNETKVTCYYSCVAQKSYGNEKRFLCPPPILIMDKRKSNLNLAAKVTVVNGNTPTGVDQTGHFDETGKTCFKYLYVTSSNRTKSFSLNISLFSHNPSEPSIAVLKTSPISIISKPSKKTQKSKTEGVCIYSGSMVSFFNRVNSQTVRTKYMGTENHKFCAKNSSWTAFTINVIKDGVPISDLSTPIEYGQEIVLTDIKSGFSSGILIIKKVTKNSIEESVGPVTHLQKVALHSKNKINSYLSLPPSSTIGSSNPFLLFQEASEDGILDDHMTWGIVGIEKAQVTLKNVPSNQMRIADARISNRKLEISGEGLEGSQVSFGIIQVESQSEPNFITAPLPPLLPSDLDSTNSATLPIIISRQGISVNTRIVLLFTKENGKGVYEIKRLV